MRFSRRKLAPLSVGLGVVLMPVLFFGRARGSDHADTPVIAANPGTDLSDVFIFPSPNNPDTVVLAMCVRPLIPAGQGNNFSFDPNTLYQFKIDNNNDNVEDLVIQATFAGNGATQQVFIAGPATPNQTGTVNTALQPFGTSGTINQAFNPTQGMQVFAGAREDPFFFDLERFFTIFPDRSRPVNPNVVVPDDNNPNTNNANVPQALSWRGPGQAVDFLSNGGFNLLAIVVEVPKDRLGPGVIGVWCTTSR